MESTPRDTPQLSLRERFLKSWFPPAAVVGGVATLVVAALRVRPESRPAAPSPPPGGTLLPMAQPALALDRHYTVMGVLGRAPASQPFRTSLSGIAIDAGDHVYALGDGEVREFGPDGRVVRQFAVGEKAQCLTVGPDQRVLVAGAGRVDIYEASGRRSGGFAVGGAASPASLTAIRIAGTGILVADASARIIRRLDAEGRPLGLIGDQHKTKVFILPNGYLDLDVDAAGVVRATDTGRHQVSSWALDGTPLGKFGKFGMSDPADFVGCCNPVNVATTPDGKVVTAEKMIARVKVFDPDGRLIAFIGPEHFDQKSTHIHLAVDSKGRILAADPVRREIQIFAAAAAGSEHPQ
jgi:hypothetical protein